MKHDEEIETAGLAMAFFKSQLRSTQRLGNTKLRRPESARRECPLVVSPPTVLGNGWLRANGGCTSPRGVGFARPRGASGLPGTDLEKVTFGMVQEKALYRVSRT